MGSPALRPRSERPHSGAVRIRGPHAGIDGRVVSGQPGDETGGDKPCRPTHHIATTASRSSSDAAPFSVGGVGPAASSGASAAAWASQAYSSFEVDEL